MKKLIIVGASGFGRELIQYIADANNVSPQWEILGFIDDNLQALEGYPCNYPILGTINDWQPKEDENFICALAFPKVKKYVVEKLVARGAYFITFIHPSATIHNFAEIGEGAVLTPNSVVSANAKVGRFSSILGSSVAHDACVGDWSTLSGRCALNGHVHVGESVYMGCGVLVAPSKRIGDNAVVGIGSVVISNVKADTTVFGNPAKKISF
ncbi:MAG: acetyltransferase [Muribaculaceae bacterium]|nr:acetyltransferase [Muribaculaceae bacterium]